jgi:hypothetical protein
MKVSENLSLDGRLLITISETSVVLGPGRNSIYALLETGELQSVVIAGRRLITIESIKALVAKRAAEPYSSRGDRAAHAPRRGRRPKLRSVAQPEPEVV